MLATTASVNSAERSGSGSDVQANVLSDVLRWQHWPAEKQRAATAMLANYSLQLKVSEPTQPIPGSFWGDDEAGLVDSCLYVRADTPVHSLLHESCHYICMTPARRAALHTNAGGTVLEECAVCYLQLLLAESLAMNRASLFRDMDCWGYSFRLGSAEQWFSHDAEDALAWLLQKNLIDGSNRPTGHLRH